MELKQDLSLLPADIRAAIELIIEFWQDLTPRPLDTHAAIAPIGDRKQDFIPPPLALHTAIPLLTKHKQGYPPLCIETRATIPTDAAAYYLNRKPQTLRAWACLENGPLRPVRINGRLNWSVSAISALLNGEAK